MDNYNDFGPQQTVFGDYWRNQLWQWLENDAVTSYGSGWRKDAMNLVVVCVNHRQGQKNVHHTEPLI